MEKIKTFYNTLNKNQRDYLLAIVFSISLSILISLFAELTIGSFFLSVSFLFFSILAVLSIFLITEALFYAGAQISLTLFLADIYCSLQKAQQTEPESDQAFTFIIGFAIIFIFIKLIKKIVLDSKKLNEQIGKENKKEHPLLYWISLGIFFLTATTVLYYAYLMFHPIVTNICFVK